MRSYQYPQVKWDSSWRTKKDLLNVIHQFKNSFPSTIAFNKDKWKQWEDDDDLFYALLEYTEAHAVFASERLKNKHKGLLSRIAQMKECIQF